MRLLSLLCLMLLGANPQAAEAQNVPISKYYFENAYDFNGIDKIIGLDFVTRYKDSLGLTAFDELKLFRQNPHENGRNDIRYEQYHKGYPVIGAQFLVHSENGVVISAAGSIVRQLNVAIPANLLTDSQLLDHLPAALPGRTFVWQADSIVAAERRRAPDATLKPAGTLVIARRANESNAPQHYRLVKQFDVEVLYPAPKRYIVSLDPATGALIDTVDALVGAGAHFADGKVICQYDSPRNGDNKLDFETYYTGFLGDYILECSFGEHIRTKVWGLGDDYTDRDNDWSDPNERMATNAHWAMQRAWEYFDKRHGNRGSDNRGKGIDMLAYSIFETVFVKTSSTATRDLYHIAAPPPQVSNPLAFFDPTLDVVGHEYTHSIIYQNSKLNPYSTASEAGAIDEGLADIFGEMSENYFRGHTDLKWKGDQHAEFSGTQYRNLADPNSSYPQGPKEYHGTYWDNGNDYYTFTHQNGAVAGKWFDLLCNRYAIGYYTGERVAYNNMMWWLYPGVSYSDFRRQSLACAVADFGGLCQPVYKAVQSAWNDVKVTGPDNCRKVVILGPNVIDPKTIKDGTRKVFRLASTDGSPLPGDADIEWLVPAGWLVTGSPDNTELVLRGTIRTTSVALRAVLNYNGMKDTVTHIVHFNVCADCLRDVPNELGAMARSSQNESREAAAYTSTGIRIFPNPAASGALYIFGSNFDSAPLKFELYSVSGILVSETTLRENKQQVDVSGLAPGVYFAKLRGDAVNEVLKVIIR